ncbi:MAG: hypothetical protein BWY06_02670 [Candidatus Latescibacteria bacterium ADurb.Bin168]|nr:MAG: hypothetical protein BWY06_02670 [Candidatus Latescibacteria bacterium ADurb.Bin168]
MIGKEERHTFGGCIERESAYHTPLRNDVFEAAPVHADTAEVRAPVAGDLDIDRR